MRWHLTLIVWIMTVAAVIVLWSAGYEITAGFVLVVGGLWGALGPMERDGGR